MRLIFRPVCQHSLAILSCQPWSQIVDWLSHMFGIAFSFTESGTDHLQKPTWSTLASLFSDEISGHVKPRLGQDLAKYLVDHDQMPMKKT